MEQPIEEAGRTPTFLRPCPQCRERMEVFNYENQFGNTLQGAACPAGHSYRQETLVALAFRLKGVVGSL